MLDCFEVSRGIELKFIALNFHEQMARCIRTEALKRYYLLTPLICIHGNDESALFSLYPTREQKFINLYKD